MASKGQKLRQRRVLKQKKNWCIWLHMEIKNYLKGARTGENTANFLIWFYIFHFLKDAAGWCRILHQPFRQSELQIRWEDFKLQIWGRGEFGIRAKSTFYSFSSQTLRPIEAGEELTVKYGNCTKTAASDAGYFPFLSLSFYHMAVMHLIIVCFSNADSLSGVGIARWLSFLFL